MIAMLHTATSATYTINLDDGFKVAVRPSRQQKAMAGREVLSLCMLSSMPVVSSETTGTPLTTTTTTNVHINSRDCCY
jgi:hypothetical protein